MRSFPPSTRKALHHFGTVIVDETPVIDLFCCAHPGDTATDGDKPTLRNIQKRFKKLSFLVHPDRCVTDRSSANKAMQKLTRAKEQAEREILFEEMENGEDASRLVPAALVFTLIPTSKEKLLELIINENEKNTRRRARFEENKMSSEAEESNNQSEETEKRKGREKWRSVAVVKKECKRKELRS